LLVTALQLNKILAIAVFFSVSLAWVCSPADAWATLPPAAPAPAQLQDSTSQQSATSAPEQVALTSQPQIPSASAAAPGNISGTVLDTNGNVLENATVTLITLSGSTVRTVKSGTDGQFVFSTLPPADYRITVEALGMSLYTSANIALAPGQAIIQPPVRLAIARATTSVTVNGNPQQLSIEQVHIAVQQRVLRVFPNFYSTYDWNAPPMLARQKFELSLRSALDPVSFATAAAIAGAEQYQNIFPDYGSGLEGYGKRYGAALANHVTGNILGKAVFPVIFHQDPRYFYKGSGSFRSRALYAMSAAVIARSDSGHWMPNYANIFGNFTAAALSNLYYPAANRGASLVLFNGLADLGADAGADLVREFILKRFTSHAPKSSAGQPSITN
jgi:Carboxypeptidase regulatory-like domain